MGRIGDYQFYKSLKICPRCTKRGAEPNKVLCFECAEEDNKRHAKKRKQNLEEHKRKDLEKYNRLKENGICTYCKHEKAIQGKTKCKKCLAKIRNKRNAQKCDISRSERISYGLCYICGKNELMKDKGVCENCYKIRLESIAKIMYMPVSEQWKKDNDLLFANKK